VQGCIRRLGEVSATAGILGFGVATSSGRAKRAKGALSLGTHIVRQACLAAGLEVLDLEADPSAARSASVVMAGLFWWEHLPEFIARLAAMGIEPRRWKRSPGRPWVFVGGQLPSYNPGPFREFADLACVGDGEVAAPEALRILLGGGSPRDCAGIPGIYVSAIDEQVEWQQVDDIGGSVRWPFRNTVREESDSGVVHVEEYEHRLEVARGCRRKCMFCGVSWTKRYRELATDDAVRAVALSPGSVKAFAPDPLRHSGWAKIDEAFRASGKANSAGDISTVEILAHGLGRGGTHLVGVDGLSARLRAAVGKPLPAGDMQRVLAVASREAGALHVYQIVDYPRETPEDYVEWITTLRDAEIGRDRFVLTVGLNTFNPTPHTPMQWEGIRLDADPMAEYWRAVNAILPADPARRLQHKMLARPFGPGRRMREAAVLRGGPELTPLYLALAAHSGKLETVARLRAAARTLGILPALDETVCERDPSVLAPWERRVRGPYPRATLLAARAAFRRRAGVG
jgi:hypothetical protein